ncbi:MAG: hypothetical protein ACTHOH_03780 [Lysobacteraceae bacterium]
MPRKLLHAVRGLGIAMGVISVGLFVGLAAPGAATIGASASAPDDGMPVTSRSHRRAMARESPALPFFSFAQTLRHGNGS